MDDPLAAPDGVPMLAWILAAIIVLALGLALGRRR